MKNLLLLLIVLGCGTLRATSNSSFADFDRRAREGNQLTIVFFGGSLTWSANASDPNVTGFRGLMADYFLRKYPKSQFRFVDAAIGGTGSNLGMFRLNRDVFRHNPDLVFLDFICNDGGENRDLLATCCYEYLLREMIGRGIPVVQMFFTFKWYVEGGGDYLTRHSRLIDYRQLAEAYQTGVGDVYCDSTILKEDLNRVWPFDGGHPGDFGYRLFAAAGQKGYERAIAEGRVCKVPEKPVFGTVQNVHRLELPHLADMRPYGWKDALNSPNSAWFDGLAARWQDGVWEASGDKISPITRDKVFNFIGFFGEGDDEALKYDVEIDGVKAKTFDGSPHVGASLYTWRYFTLKDWGTGAAMAHQYAILPQANGKGKLRLNSICTATICPNSKAGPSASGAASLEAIDHARGKK